MKRITYIIASALLLASCGGQKLTPVQQAVADKVLELNPTYNEISFQRFEVVDSTTYGTELARRKGLFELKNAKAQERLENYAMQHKVKNFEAQAETIAKSKKILSGLDSLISSFAQHVDEIAYYDVSFDATVTNRNQVLHCDGLYAVVTPDLRVLCVVKDRKNLHKGMGTVIPGYDALLGGDKDED